ncbi:MAG: LPS export ABC transporter periplasmic protein LptC [Gammaproteobacteria bacterium]|nr:LPS export ABC transporter periplasmic protein LptC [Gammaproteobacteria bacterium]
MRNGIYIILALLICIGSIFILHRTSKPAHPAQKKIIDSFVLNASYTEFNQDGQVKTKMSAAKVIHFIPDNTTHFTKPVMLTYMDNRDPWHITADKGNANKTGSEIILKGHVIVKKLPTEKQESLTITTSELAIFPKESRAVTKQAVTLTRPGTVIHATGFTANLKTGQYQLLSKSTVIYQPEQRQH